jgi:carboxyl-terminal processing protease
VIPDIEYPSLFDPEQIGESALDNALAWDQIAPARFNRYNDYRPILPTLTDLHEKRAANDPDYLYLKDQVSLAKEARTITALPLWQSGRLEMRDDQEQKALEIENKRRVAKGLEPLATLNSGDTTDDTTNSEDAEGGTDSPGQEDSEAELIGDVLLMETGRILVDTITLRPNTGLASRGKRAG